MLAYRQAFASSVVKKYLTLFKHKWGGDASHIGILLSSQLFVGYHAILPMRDASSPFVLEFESEEPGSTARPARVYTLATRMMSANTPAAVTSAPAP